MVPTIESMDTVATTESMDMVATMSEFQHGSHDVVHPAN